MRRKDKAVHDHENISNIIRSSQVCRLALSRNDKPYLVPDETAPCDWSCSFQSIIGFGTVHELIKQEDKVKGLTHIMHQYSNKIWDFENVPLGGVKVWKIAVDSMTAKQSPDHFETA